MRVGHAWVMMVCGLLLQGAARAGDQEYAIETGRAAKAGDVYEFHETIEHTTTTTVNQPDAAPATAKQSLLAELSGRMEVLAVDEGGNEKDAALTVTKFGAGAASKSVVAVGKVIEIRRTDKEVTFSLRGGGAVDDEAEKALGRIFHPVQAEGIPAGAVTGGKQTRKVGESWAVDARSLFERGLGSGVQFDSEKATAMMTLKDVETVSNIQALRLVFHSTIPDFVPSGLATGSALEYSELKMEISQLLPVDRAIRVTGLETTADMRAVLTNDKTHAKIEIKTHVVEKRTTVPVSK
jgi:hypothetical protein